MSMVFGHYEKVQTVYKILEEEEWATPLITGSNLFVNLYSYVYFQFLLCIDIVHCYFHWLTYHKSYVISITIALTISITTYLLLLFLSFIIIYCRYYNTSPTPNVHLNLVY